MHPFRFQRQLWDPAEITILTNEKSLKDSSLKSIENILVEGASMEFCPQCGTRLVLKRRKEAKEVSLACPKCEYKKPMDRLIPASKTSGTRSQDQIIVIGKKEQRLQTLPTVTIECPKCGNNLAYVWQVQTRGADESSTQFFRCTKCNYTFREYS